MPYTLGLDSSTQSLSAVLLDLDQQRITHELSVPFGELTTFNSPRGFIEPVDGIQVHADPQMWLAALDVLLERMREAGWPLAEVVALSGSGQQHGSVYLRAGFADTLKALDPQRPLAGQFDAAFARATSPIWMDGSTTEECAEIAAAMGGNEAVCALSGSVATERFTGPQIRAFWKRDPQGYAETSRIHLVSSFLCSIWLGDDAPIDTGDGAGMNLMNLAAEDWDPALLAATAPDLAAKLPAIRPAAHVCGTIAPWFVQRHGFSPDCKVLPFSGDNPCSLVGMSAATPGRVVVSLGTSDTLFAAVAEPLTDPNGCGHVFGNPLGGYMTLSCIRNGSLAREAFRDELGVDWSAFEAAGWATLPDDAACLPFVVDEITPKRAAGCVESNPELDDAQRIRAFLEGQAFNLLHQLEWMKLKPEALYLTGGASRNSGITQVFADVFGVPVHRLAIGNSAAQGAALYAALGAGFAQQSLTDALRHVESTTTPRQQAASRYQGWLNFLK